ncbi:TolC family protein [Alteromonas lipolytica]|uniref:Multidrug transporter n=1 Tax=Alteromonas lipolytica TaxID=1856405 RepID=A0A1E8FJH7_9ALTE|nr:TolC family protein [Alteromonas lipolytica]OFI36075.1 multidrug transporter [Alteromonas lipolytica]GGF71169.1 multidrug transporter [Alteromonas lipolytica]
MELRKILFVWLLGAAPLALAEDALPTVPGLIANMQQYHPYVGVLNEKNNQMQFGLQSAQSEFDPRIEQDISGRLSGYYDGSAAAQRFVQPLGEMNARLISEYRVATGDFPVYEEQYNTLSGGEASIGVALSLLKDRSTDKRRVGVANARLSVQQYQAELQLGVNDFLYKGLSQYLKWYEVSLKIAAVESLLETLSSRRDGLKERLSKGDLAQVTLTEFEASILEQQLALSQLQQTQRAAAQALAFYWRDNQGQSRVIHSQATLPEDIRWPYAITPVQVANLRNAIVDHPALAVIRTEQAVAKNKYRLAENQLLPKLDLKALVARDIGSGPASLAETEGKVGLTFSYTLGNRKAKAEQATQSSKLKVLEYELQLAKDRLSQQFEQTYAYWQQANEVLELQRKNAELAVTLSTLERKRFDAGDSDMFKLNARESGVLKAKLKAIEAEVDLLSAELALHQVAVSLAG